MDFISRENCVLTGKKDLDYLYSFKHFPVRMECTEESAANDVFADMCWCISRETGIIQLSHLIPPEVLYVGSHAPGMSGNLWLQHHKDFAAFIHTFCPSHILEIGGAHGMLCREYSYLASIDWTIIEPSDFIPDPDVQANYIQTFFDNNFKPEFFVETVIHSHVMEHFFDPVQQLRTIASILPINGKHIFSLPNMEVWLERKYANCLNFEHTILLTEPFIDNILMQCGFDIIEKQYFGDGHSIFYSTLKTEKKQDYINFISYYDKYKILFDSYVYEFKKITSMINATLEKNNNTAFIFGAHIFTQILLSFGVKENLINRILDNAPSKHGKRLYGTRLMVSSPSYISDIDSPIVILRAGSYSEEIKKDILENINGTTIFL